MGSLAARIRANQALDMLRSKAAWAGDRYRQGLYTPCYHIQRRVKNRALELAVEGMTADEIYETLDRGIPH